MENPFDDKINNDEIIFLGNDVILKSEGIHNSVVVTEGVMSISKDLLPAIQNLYYKKSMESVFVGNDKNISNTTITDPVDKDVLLPAISLEELLKTEFPEARWVVDGLFESGTINMISAPPNKWKSWIVILCAICVASGKELFEKFVTEKQVVMIVNEEDNARLLQERCNMLMKEPEALPIYFHIGKQIKLEDEFIDQLILEAKEKKIGLIIFDSLRSVHDADENSSQAMQEIMNQLKKITREGVTVLMTHHNRKKSRDSKNSTSGEESRGSSAINAGIHGHLSCDEEDRGEDKYLVISQQKLKAGPKMSPFEILVKNDIENHKFCFLYSGEYKKEEEKMNKVKEIIMDTFLKNESGFSVKDFKNMNIGGETMIRLVLKVLEAQKFLQVKTLKEAQSEGLSISSNEGNHNTKIYFKITSSAEMKDDQLDNF